MSPWKRKSNNAAGVFLILLILGVKVAALDHANPNAATPWILALLSIIAASALAAAVAWHRRAARQSV